LIIFISCNIEGDIEKVRKIDMGREIEMGREMERGGEGESWECRERNILKNER
jgi:hypothetical protein